jgi:acylpyruvate hydrolase
MRYATFEHSGARHVGEVRGDTLVPLRHLTEIGPGTPLDALRAAPREVHRAVGVDEVTLLPVVPNPRKMLCVGLNYADHIAETGRERPTYPVLFPKYADSLLGAYDDIVLPPESHQVDYEGELAVVIGVPGRRIRPESALEHVAGYTVANDVTVRDYQYKTHQWLQGKAWDATTPLGPYLVTADEVDLATAGIRTVLNGRPVQESSVDQLVLGAAELISLISEFTALAPGDVILTGTPGGVGYRREPQVFLRDGDVVAVEIDGIGRVENRVVAAGGGPAPAPGPALGGGRVDDLPEAGLITRNHGA